MCVRERERERQTDRQTDRQTETETEIARQRDRARARKTQREKARRQRDNKIKIQYIIIRNIFYSQICRFFDDVMKKWLQV